MSKKSNQQNSMPLSPRLSVYKWYAPMLASIMHRISGVMLVLFVPFYLWVLHGMTGIPQDYDNALALLHSGFGRLTLWLAGVALAYHFCNGIRFLVIDAGWCESHRLMRLSARIVLLVPVFLAPVLGWLLW